MTEEKANVDTGPVFKVIEVDPPSIIERLASNPNVDVEKLERIMKMQEQTIKREAQTAFNAAMVKAQNKIEIIAANEKNTQTGSTYAYAGLKDVITKAKPVYTAEGFSLMFYEGDSPDDKKKRTCVDIMHEQGHTEKRHIDLTIQTTGIAGKAMMTQIHGEGSAFSYGRRYLTCMIFNIPTGDDDDGNKAGKSGEPTPLEQWGIKCNEVGESAKSIEELTAWWETHGPAVKKELKTKDAAMIHNLLNAHKNRIKAQREPGSDDG
jgi:hypothetical protein